MLNWLNKNNLIVAGFVFVVLTNISIWILLNTPAKSDFACINGANFTIHNALIAIGLSALLSLNIVGLAKLIREKQNTSKVKLASLSGFAAFMWILSTICFACYLPIFVVFGFSVSLSFLSNYEIWFGLMGMLLSGVSLFMLDRQIRFGCLNPDKCKT